QRGEDGLPPDPGPRPPLTSSAAGVRVRGDFTPGRVPLGARAEPPQTARMPGSEAGQPQAALDRPPVLACRSRARRGGDGAVVSARSGRRVSRRTLEATDSAPDRGHTPPPRPRRTTAAGATRPPTGPWAAGTAGTRTPTGPQAQPDGHRTGHPQAPETAHPHRPAGHHRTRTHPREADRRARR